jgi:formiminotetrahydrofolate cyclodeaminase
MIQEGVAKQYVLDDPIQIEPSWTEKRVQDALRAGAKTPSEIAIESGVGLKQVKSIVLLGGKTCN